MEEPSVTEEKTAEDLSEWYQKLLNSGVKKVFWFYIKNYPNDENITSYGFFRQDDDDFENPTQVYYAYQNIAYK